MAQHSDALAVPDLNWLGVHPSDIDTLCLMSLPMKHTDFQRARSILRRPYVDEEIKKELQILMNMEKKCEIESLSVLKSDFLINTFIPVHISAALNVHRNNKGIF